VENAFSLVACTVAPSFDFNDFELVNQSKLIDQYPSYSKLIEEMCA